MTALPQSDGTMSATEYLALERASEIKHEFIDGRVHAMTGASEAHNLITANIIAVLHGQMRGRPCKLYPSDMKVRTPDTGSYVYPDVTVVCGEAQFDDEQRDVLLNPTVVIEVLSPHTEAYDRGVKFRRCREIASLQEYVLIAQDRPAVERFTRQEGGVWQFHDASGLEATVTLPSIGCELALAAVYEQVTFDTGEDAGPS